MGVRQRTQRSDESLRNEQEQGSVDRVALYRSIAVSVIAVCIAAVLIIGETLETTQMEACVAAGHEWVKEECRAHPTP